MKRTLILFTVSLFSFTSISTIFGQVETRIDRANGTPKMVKFDDSFTYSGNPKQLLKQITAFSGAEDYKQIKTTEKDKAGTQHLEFQQYYNGLKVEYGIYKIHLKNDQPYLLNGERYDIQDLDVRPSINRNEALSGALNFVNATQYKWEENANLKPKGELVIVPKYITDEKDFMAPTLAYKFDIYASEPLSRDFIYVDAKTGKVIHVHPIIIHSHKNGNPHLPKNKEDHGHGHVHDSGVKSFINVFEAPATGSAATRYSGNQNIGTDSNNGSFRLRDNTRGNGVYTWDLNTGTNYNNAVDFVDNDNSWTSNEWNNAAKDNGALDAHWGAMMTYDYFLSVHNRNSYDGNGARINSYIHYSSNYDNAFWDGLRMTYGDGSGNGGFDILTSLDVAAHEIGHAICSNTANLVYQRESGALNEGFSDIWAAVVEEYAAPGKDEWLVGEDIDLRGPGFTGLRSMENPNYANDPDTYGGSYWLNPNCGTPTRSNDYCGVHSNSGVLNHWFYLITVGGSGTNDIGSNFSVTSIGMTNAAAITYRLEAVYLSANSTFADARAFAIQSAIDLYGAGSQEEITVTNAWYAVGVGSEYCVSNCPLNYCTSSGNNVSDEYIGRVQVGSIDNASGASGGYTDHTSISTDLTQNTQYTITVTPTWTGTVYSEGYAAWIDYNQDGDFEDSGEQIFSRSPTSTTPVSGSFTVPSSATTGNTTMRVSMSYNATPGPCGTFTYGEVEDYTVNIVSGGGGDTQPPSTPSNLSASNVTASSVDLSWTASTDNVGVTEYDVYQDGSLTTSVSGTSATMTGLSASTSYAFYVIAKDAAGNTSSASNTVNVTTDSGSVPDTEAPTAPTGLSASNITTSSVDLSWNASSDNVGVTGYTVYVDGSIETTVSGTSYQVTGLASSTTYDFYVTASDAAGNESGASNTVTETTQSTGGGGTTILHEGFFESGWDGWVDGGNDCARVNNSSVAYEGNYSIRIRDNSGVASSMTLNSINVSGYDQVEVEFYFYVSSMETNEDFWLRFNDGSGWTTVGSWVSGSSFNGNGFYTTTVPISSSSFNFGSSASFRFQCDASGNGDRIYIDQVTIRGVSNGAAAIIGEPIVTRLETPNGFVPFEDMDETEGFDVKVFPNPVRDELTVQMNLEQRSEVYLNLYNVTGQLVRHIALDQVEKGYFEYDLDVSILSAGMYYLEIENEEEVLGVKKVLKSE